MCFSPWRTGVGGFMDHRGSPWSTAGTTLLFHIVHAGLGPRGSRGYLSPSSSSLLTATRPPAASSRKSTRWRLGMAAKGRAGHRLGMASMAEGSRWRLGFPACGVHVAAAWDGMVAAVGWPRGTGEVPRVCNRTPTLQRVWLGCQWQPEGPGRSWPRRRQARRRRREHLGHTGAKRACFIPNWRRPRAKRLVGDD